MPRKIKRTPDGFLLNEPAARIPGGSKRTSVLVDRKSLPLIARRVQLNSLLLWHDLELPAKQLNQISSDDIRLLRQIVVEGATTNQIPAIRYSAILLLARWPDVESLNLLHDLARYGEDVYVRSYALLALGSTKLTMVGETLRDGLASSDQVERNAAAKALATLGRAAGPAAIAALASREPRSRVVEKLNEIRKALGQATPARRTKTKPRTTSSKRP